MARIRKVTRTIEMKKAKVLCVNPDTRDFKEIEIKVNNENKPTDTDILGMVKTLYPDFIGVQIVSYVVEDRLFSMDEDFFINHATESPARGTVTEGE